MRNFSVLAMAFGMAVSAAAHASPVTSGFDAQQIAACDDCFTSAVALGFDANFFGTTYSNAYISNNGYITFNSGQGTYTPTGLGASYNGQPIIAAFYADVDTRGVGSGLTTYGTGVYEGHTAFGVTYPAVGYYGAHTDKLNTFQLILVDREDIGTGDFDIFFNYGQIQWETGDASGGSAGLGGVSAAVGYSNGSGAAGTYGQLDGSLVNGAFLDGGPHSLVTGTNDGITGQYEFSVRNGVVIPPVIPVPEPSALLLFGAGLAGLGLARKRNSLWNLFR